MSTASEKAPAADMSLRGAEDDDPRRSGPPRKYGPDVWRTCEVCGAVYEAKAWEVARGQAKFCSRECSSLGRRRRTDVRTTDNGVRARRVKVGLTIAELAARAGVNKSTLSCIQNGYNRPSWDVARRIADALGTPVCEVFQPNACGCGCGMLTFGRFVTGHSSRLPEHGAHVARGHRARRRRLGIPEQKTCKRCGRIFTRSEVRNQSDAHWLQRGYCSGECRWPIRVEPRVCARDGCNRTFKPSHRADPRRRHCSRICAQRERWRRLLDIPDAVIDALPPRARAHYNRLKNLAIGRVKGQHEKGKTSALEVGEAALRIVLAKPQATQTRNGRRAVIETLMLQFICGREIIDHGTADTDYEAARAKIKRRLARAYRELGQPAQLAPLI